jgi:hypothetical protein
LSSASRWQGIFADKCDGQHTRFLPKRTIRCHNAPLLVVERFMSVNDATIETTVLRWLERAVIGLNLCPFARAPHVAGRIRIAISRATDVDGLLGDLSHELMRLKATPEDVVETTLLVHPEVLQDFLDFNDFLDVADATLEALDLDGELQVASFHPDYQFADSGPDDIENFSNRRPTRFCICCAKAASSAWWMPSKTRT